MAVAQNNDNRLNKHSPHSLDPTAGMRRMALCLAYDGSPWQGWQTQPGHHSIQDQLERALARFLGQATPVICAGRTDAGVHARGQVVHFDTAAQRLPHAWVRALNSFLPDSIAVQWTMPVPEDFHARFAAIGRHYTYRLVNHPVIQPLLRGRAGWCHRPLNFESMQEAATHLIGTHDFSSFRSSECQAATPVRTLRRVALQRNGPLISFEFEGNAFLHHMVRNLVGMLVYVGLSRLEAAAVPQLIGCRNRRLAPPTYSADGLYFDGPAYLPKWELPPIPAGISPFLSQ